MVKIAACQLPEIREDRDALLSLISDYAKQAMDQDVQLLCFPECFLQGYLLEEATARKNALELTSGQFQSILKNLPANSPALVIGLIESEKAACIIPQWSSKTGRCSAFTARLIY